MWRVQVVVVVAALFTARVVAADEVGPDTKDRATAVILSAAGAAASIGLVAAGASSHNSRLVIAGLVGSLIAPAAGEIYAGEILSTGTRIRVASASVGVLAVLSVPDCRSNDCGGSGGVSSPLLALAGVGYAVGILCDIAAAGNAVDDYNRRHRLRVTPTVIPTAASGPAIGLGLSASF